METHLQEQAFRNSWNQEPECHQNVFTSSLCILTSSPSTDPPSPVNGVIASGGICLLISASRQGKALSPTC